MKLWLLEARDDAGPFKQVPYDSAYGFVVRALTAEDARMLADAQHGDEGGAWLDPLLTTCQELRRAGEPGVVLRDFLNG